MKVQWASTRGLSRQRRGRRARWGRAGFTLIELLVVVTIIAVLATLSVKAVMSAWGMGQKAQQVEEITQLSNSLTSFREKFGIFPPSRIRLRENTPYNVNGDVFDQHSVNYLRRIWSEIQLPGTPGTTTGIVWCADNPGKTWQNVMSTGQTYELEGDECLVFFLGGIAEFNRANPDKFILHGFTSAVTNPGGIPRPSRPQSANRDGPFYEFQQNRLFVRFGAEMIAPPCAIGHDLSQGPRPPKLPSYQALFATKPVAYFSGYEGLGCRPNDICIPEPQTPLKPNYAVNWATGGWGMVTIPGPQCYAPLPYTKSEPAPLNDTFPVYHNANSYQLISPGADDLYGAGGKIPRAQSDYNGDLRPGNASFDNYSNISGNGALGDYNEDQ